MESPITTFKKILYKQEKLVETMGSRTFKNRTVIHQWNFRNDKGPVVLEVHQWIGHAVLHLNHVLPDEGTAIMMDTVLVAWFVDTIIVDMEYMVEIIGTKLQIAVWPQPATVFLQQTGHAVHSRILVALEKETAIRTVTAPVILSVGQITADPGKLEVTGRLLQTVVQV